MYSLMSIELTQVDDADLSDADSDVHNPVTVFHNESAGVLTRFKELLDRRPYLCRYFDCEERFENIETRTIHGNTHFCSRNHPFTHSKCPTSFISTEDFTYHERYEHKRSIIGWRCNLCLPSENIQRRYGLEEHLQMFHPERCADPTRDVLLRGGRARKLCSWLLIFRDGSEKEKSVISGSLSERERRTVHLLARQLGLWPLSRKTDEGLEIIVNRFASNSTVFEPIYKDALAQGPVSFPSRSITPTIPTTTLIPDRKRKRLVGGSPTFTAEGSGLRVTFKKSKKVGRPTIPWSVASKRLLVRFVTLSHCKPELLESALKENGFSAGIRHIQTKVRNMFGPMKPHDPGYDRELRPNNSDEMNFRVRALLDCKEQWYMLKHRLNLPKKMDRLEIDDPGSEIPPLLGNSDIWDSLCLAPELDEYVTTDSMEVAQAIGFEEGNNLSSNLYDRRMTDFEGHVDCDRNDINPLDDATQLLVAGKYSRSAHEHTTCPRDVRALPIQSATSTKSQAGFDHMPLGTTPAHSTTRPVSKKPLTMEDRRQICLYHMKWPSAKQVEIAGKWGVDRSTISKVLRDNGKYLRSCDLPPIPEFNHPPQFPPRSSHLHSPSEVEPPPLPNWQHPQIFSTNQMPYRCPNASPSSFTSSGGLSNGAPYIFSGNESFVSETSYAQSPSQPSQIPTPGKNARNESGVKRFLRFKYDLGTSAALSTTSLQEAQEIIEAAGGRPSDTRNLYQLFYTLSVSNTSLRLTQNDLHPPSYSSCCGMCNIPIDSTGNHHPYTTSTPNESTWRNKKEKSCLHCAVQYGRRDSVSTLLENGAHPWTENPEGMNPAVYGWGFLEKHKDEVEMYQNILVCMLKVIEKQRQTSGVAVIREQSFGGFRL